MAAEGWDLTDLPWNSFDPERVDPEMLSLVKAASLVESNGRDYGTYLCRVFRHDRDFQDEALAWARGLPWVGVDHLEGHLNSVFLAPDPPPFPFAALLVSGGHCQLLAVEGVGRYRRLGGTIDDAVGEAFDKSAKLMGLPYPGGPSLERAAEGGDPGRFDLPRPLLGRDALDFSFSGLKTAVRQKVAALTAETEPLSSRDAADLAASFQAAVGDVLADRCRRALQRFRQETGQAGPLVVAGGVAANRQVRARLTEAAAGEGADFVAPPIELCTDNAAMIAWAGIERLKLGLRDGLDFAPRPRWPLEALRDTARHSPVVV